MAQGKQNEGAACPKDKLEFKFFSSPEEEVDKGVRVNVTVYQGSTYMITCHHPYNASINFIYAGKMHMPTRMRILRQLKSTLSEKLALTLDNWRDRWAAYQKFFFHCILGAEYPEGEVEPPPPISLEELQGEVRTVAHKVLSRPQSGMVFMEDVKTAIAMWADRLSYLLGPLKSGMLYHRLTSLCVVDYAQ